MTIQPIKGINRAQAWMQRHQQVSESAFAVTFAEIQEERWRYDTDERMWLQWVGTHWARRQTPEMLNELRNFLVKLTQVLKRAEIITTAEAIKFQSQRSVSAIEKLCRSLPSFIARSVLFDSDPWLLGTPGGTVDLRTGELRPARPEDFITMLTRVAPAKTEDCPRWIRFIDEVTSGDKDLGKYLRQWAGLSQCGDPFHQRLSFLCGGGRNGKNTYADTLVNIAGDYAYSANFDVFVATRFSQHTTDVWSLKGKRMVIASEVPDGATWNTQRIKDLTGNATITARAMKKDNESFVRSITITLLGNGRPKIKNADAAMKARLKIIPFDRDFEAEGLLDPGLSKALLKEAPGILRWAINGLLEVLEAKGKIIEPARVAEETQSYLDKYDLRRQFVAKCIDKNEEAPDEEIPIHEFYAAWKGFAEAMDIDPLNERSFAVWLVKLTGAKQGKRTGPREKRVSTVKGIKLKSAP